MFLPHDEKELIKMMNVPAEDLEKYIFQQFMYSLTLSTFGNLLKIISEKNGMDEKELLNNVLNHFAKGMRRSMESCIKEYTNTCESPVGKMLSHIVPIHDGEGYRLMFDKTLKKVQNEMRNIMLKGFENTKDDDKESDPDIGKI